MPDIRNAAQCAGILYFDIRRAIPDAACQDMKSVLQIVSLVNQLLARVLKLRTKSAQRRTAPSRDHRRHIVTLSCYINTSKYVAPTTWKYTRASLIVCSTKYIIHVMYIIYLKERNLHKDESVLPSCK
ncbi:Hypothetical_protein [Hexamita inflata]|uniref:Hypothetical_protein n=1 Tax=Hexamita inflata TaxID=28002 RepID=A0AA86QB90_9EUKA|nr:Hypothetical protein HINF_LOCUS36625 [Hexamita inflata]